jgi:hypothetical protein
MEGVSFLTNAYKQFANKPIQDCIKDGFPSFFLCCQNPQATELSIMPMSLCQSQGGAGATCTSQITWVLFLFPRHMESTQLYELESFVIMLQMMNLTIMTIPHCIFNVT